MRVCACWGPGAYTTKHVALLSHRTCLGPSRPGTRAHGPCRGPGRRPPSSLLRLAEETGAAGLAALEGTTGLTHLMCRPSCCTPRAGSSDTPSTPTWWAPRRHTPPGPRRGICGRERRDQVLTTWHTAHPPPGPVVSAPLSTVTSQSIQSKTFLAGTALSPYSVHHGPSHPADAPVSWAHCPSASAPTSSQGQLARP